MPDLKKALRDLADLYEREEEGESSSALTARIDALEAKLADAPKDEKNEALEEITEEEYELIRQHRAGATAPPPKAKVEKPAPVEDPKPAKVRPGRKSGRVYNWTVDDAGEVQRIDIPTLYSGQDEPDEVPITAEDAA